MVEKQVGAPGCGATPVPRDECTERGASVPSSASYVRIQPAFGSETNVFRNVRPQQRPMRDFGNDVIAVAHRAKAIARPIANLGLTHPQEFLCWRRAARR